MINDTIIIKPIKPDEWLPDRCLNGSEAFDPNSHLPESGCPALNYSLKFDRRALIQLYKSSINNDGGCGFVAWDDKKIVAYHNFFSSEIAQKFKFYGYGLDSIRSEKTLIHNCLSIVKGRYLRKGISSRLVNESIIWARTNGWKRFEVHLVLPDCEKGWQSDQKSCYSFWKKFGFKIFKEYEADKDTKLYYGVSKRLSMYLSLDNKDI